MWHSYQLTEVCISWFWFNNGIQEPKGELNKFQFLKYWDSVYILALRQEWTLTRNYDDDRRELQDYAVGSIIGCNFNNIFRW